MNKLLIADWLSEGGAEGLLVGDLANLSSCGPSWNYPNPAPLAAAGVRGELRINATRWQTNKNQNTKEPAELQL